MDAEFTDNSNFSEFSNDFKISQLATSQTLVFEGFASSLLVLEVEH